MQKQLQQIDDEDYTQFLQEKKEEEANIMSIFIFLIIIYTTNYL